MPPATRGRKRDTLTYVFANFWLIYGFKTQDISRLPDIGESELSVSLGHLNADFLDISGEFIRIFGANAPKPPRVKKKLQGITKSCSTYCGYDYIGEAKEAGWNLLKPATMPRVVGLNAPRSTVTAFIEIYREYNETELAYGFYGFPINKQDFTEYTQQLKLFHWDELTETDRQRIFMGANSPKPGKASINRATGTFSSFYDDSLETDLINAGWKTSPEVP